MIGIRTLPEMSTKPNKPTLDSLMDDIALKNSFLAMKDREEKATERAARLLRWQSVDTTGGFPPEDCRAPRRRAGAGRAGASQASSQEIELRQQYSAGTGFAPSEARRAPASATQAPPAGPLRASRTSAVRTRGGSRPRSRAVRRLAFEDDDSSVAV